MTGMSREQTLAMPKAELHIHAEATLQAELLLKLADRNGRDIGSRDLAEIRASYEWNDLGDFLAMYYRNMDVLQRAEDFRDLVLEYGKRAVSQGVRRFELFFDPQGHTRRGIPLETVLEGMDAGVEAVRGELAISGALIACFLRDEPVAGAHATLDGLLAFGSPNLIGVGLDSVEIGYPPSLFVDVYDRARAAGLRCVAHAGEEGGPEMVREALDLLHAERIDHGFRSIEDPSLVQRLRDEGVPLNMCPLSNVRIRAVGSLEAHPLARLLRAGCRVTINADGPAYFGGYVGDNYVAAASALNLSDAELVTIARNSIEAAFLGDAERRVLLAELDAFVAAGV